MNWDVKKLSDIATTLEDGNWIESKDQSPNGIRLVQTGNVGDGRFKDRRDKARYISEETFKKLRCIEIHPGDILVSRLPDPVGRACVLPKTGEKMITAVDCTIIRLNENECLPKWLLYYTISDTYQFEIQKRVTGATRQRISRKNLGLIPIPVAPLPEQQRIVSILDEAFAAIDKAKTNAEQNLQNAKELFESYLQGVFESGDWETRTLNEIAENLDSKRVPITKSKRESGDIPYYGASGIVDYVADYLFDEDLLCISEDGANLLARTYPIAFSISGKTWVNNHAHVLKFSSLTTQKFVEIYINSVRIDEYLSGMAQPKLNQRMLNKIPIPMPTIEEEEAIVDKIDALRAETQKLEALYQKKIDDLDELKKSILQKAFAGELETVKTVAV